MESTIFGIGPSGENKQVPLLAFNKISAPRQTCQLPDDFVPRSSDVICGRGKQRHNHAGNKRFRDTIATNVHRYMQADSKLDKTLVVLSIVENIREGPPESGFVKQDEVTLRWHDIGDKLAREKVGHALRDAITAHKKGNKKKKSFKQKSSLKMKQTRQMTRKVVEEVKEEGIMDEHFEKFLVDTFLEPTNEGSLNEELVTRDIFAEIPVPDGQETRAQPTPLPSEVPESIAKSHGLHTENVQMNQSRPQWCPHFNFGEKQVFD